MQRVVIFGRGGAGKSVLAARLGAAVGLPVTELDALFWSPDLSPAPAERWAQVQRHLVSAPRWVLDGDLGPYDVPEVRLRAADTVIVLDFPFCRCAWRALRRSRQNTDFWRWLIGYRRRSLPAVMDAISRDAAGADVYVLRNPRAVRRFLARAGTPGHGC